MATMSPQLPTEEDLDFTVELAAKVVSDVDWMSGRLRLAADDPAQVLEVDEADVGRLLLFARSIHECADSMAEDAAKIEKAIVSLYLDEHDQANNDYAAYKRRMRGMYEKYLDDFYGPSETAN
jgi:hypothetical protein